jgi:soluble lytic murein transglycosylase-like protein
LTRTSTVRRAAGSGLVVVGCALILFSAGPAAADEGGLFYYVSGGEIVFTNAPSHAGAREVPGMQQTTPLAAADLPATRFDPYIEQVARETGLAASLIKAVALVESGFDPLAVSPKGAMGLMQLMPGTARQYGVRDAFDPGQNLRAGATHLRGLLDEFNGDLTLALAAYNAGSAAVKRYGGVPAYRETQNYVRKVRETLNRGRGRNGGETPGAGHAAEPVRLVRGKDGTILLVN